MNYAYVIYSPSFKRLYKGHCHNLDQRLNEHNSGKVKSTKAFRPWQFIYFEEFQTLNEAVKRETYFKSAAGRRYLKNKITI